LAAPAVEDGEAGARLAGGAYEGGLDAACLQAALDEVADGAGDDSGRDRVGAQRAEDLRHVVALAARDDRLGDGAMLLAQAVAVDDVDDVLGRVERDRENPCRRPLPADGSPRTTPQPPIPGPRHLTQ